MGAVWKAIKARHLRDVLVGECNTGSTWGGCRRMDAWAMTRSWSPLTTYGYEFKRDRGDFLRDSKWPDYLPYCHEFYFVCPWKLIAPEELPDHVGILWVNKGGKAVTKRRAPRREPEPAKLVEIMAYVLMSRTRIVANMHHANGAGQARIDDWRAWLEGRSAHHQVGHAVRQAINKQAGDVLVENQRLKAENERLQAVKEQLAALGLDGDARTWELRSRLDELRGVVSPQVIRDLQQQAAALTRVAGHLEKLRQGPER